MRRLFVITGIFIFFGTQSLAYFRIPFPVVLNSILREHPEVIQDIGLAGFNLEDLDLDELGLVGVDLSEFITQKPSASKPSTSKPSTSKPSTLKKESVEVAKLLKKMLELKQQKLSQAEKLYQSITRDPTTKTKEVDYTSLLFKNPESIYDESNRSKEFYKKILEEEDGISGPFSSIGKYLFARLQYASSVDKAVVLQSFRQTENRFKHLLESLDELKKAKNLKDVVNFQSYMDGLKAMIDNEAIKLQMVQHLRTSEHRLTKTQRRKLDMKIFDHENNEMPRIRSVR